jgi:hypothetical protein
MRKPTNPPPIRPDDPLRAISTVFRDIFAASPLPADQALAAGFKTAEVTV